MRKYSESRQLRTVVCNSCGKKLAVKEGILREGAVCFDVSFGYFSEKDGEVHHFDLCESCLGRLEQEFRIPPEVEETPEFL